MTLHQIDPLIRELVEYRDLIQQRIDSETNCMNLIERSNSIAPCIICGGAA